MGLHAGCAQLQLGACESKGFPCNVAPTIILLGFCAFGQKKCHKSAGFFASGRCALQLFKTACKALPVTRVLAEQGCLLPERCSSLTSGCSVVDMLLTILSCRSWEYPWQHWVPSFGCARTGQRRSCRSSTPLRPASSLSLSSSSMTASCERALAFPAASSVCNLAGTTHLTLPTSHCCFSSASDVGAAACVILWMCLCCWISLAM